MEAAREFQNWPTSICYVLLASGLAAIIAGLVWRRPPLPERAPALIGQGYPILGMPRFFLDRSNFCYDGIAASSSGHFSLFFGKHQIVVVSGSEGRKIFYESKDLDMSEGYADFFPVIPRAKNPNVVGKTDTSHSKWSSKIIATMMRKENLVKYLPLLVNDGRGRFESLIAAAGTVGTFDPFDVVYRLIYHLTMRTLGANDIVKSPELLEETLALFEQIEASSSPTRIIFPWLPTPAYIRRTAASQRLYAIFSKVVEYRETRSERDEDALQYLLDNGNDKVKIISFILDTLFSSQFNSGFSAAWMLLYLACNTEWYGIVQREIDSAVSSRRSLPIQSPADILAMLTIEEWEANFPMLDLCLRECIRLQLVGTGFRKNVSGRDLPLGKTGEIIPNNAYVVYLIDEIHMAPDVYTDPQRWDPGRYLPGRNEDKKQPLGWLGWGLGRNPCLGMRFAKLEISIIIALFVAMFDFELLDVHGGKMNGAPTINRNKHAAGKPDVPVRLRYTVRQH